MALRTVTGRGIFRSSLHFLRRHFWAIMAISAAPMLMDMLLIAGTTWLDAHGHSGQLGHRQAPAAGSLLRNEFAISLSYLIALWMAVRIYRYRLSFAFQVGQDDLVCYSWTLTYCLGFVIVLALARMTLAALTMGFAAGGMSLVSLAFGYSNPDPLYAAIGLTAIAMAVGSAIWLLYMSVRLNIALPGVAIGERPSILRRMWPMGRNVAWPLTGCWLLLLADTLIATLALAFALSFAAGTHPEWIASLSLEVPYLLFSIASAVLFAEAYVQLNRDTA